MATTSKRNRPDHDGTHRLAFERNKKKIFATCADEKKVTGGALDMLMMGGAE